MIKLKDLLSEFIFGLGATGGSGPVSKAQAEKRAADKTKKNTDTKDKADKNTTWKDAKIKNPATGNEISIKSALGYPKDSEVYIQAIKIGKEKYNVPNSSGEYNRYFDKDGKKREKAFENTIKLKDLLKEEAPIYKDWDEFVKPDYILVTLKNGKKLKIDKFNYKGSSSVYQAILKAFNNNNHKITNKVVSGMLDRLGESYNPAEAFNKKVSKMTDRNEHSTAAVELAIYMDDRDAVRKLQQIKKDHDKRGSLSTEDSKERSSLVDKLLKKAKKELSEKDYKLINSSF